MSRRAESTSSVVLPGSAAYSERGEGKEGRKEEGQKKRKEVGRREGGRQAL